MVSKINNFDILRLILAVLVVFAHWNTLTQSNYSSSIFYLSGYAVDMFFIVSGFLIFWSFDKDNNIKDFFIKRFFRIYPLYFLIIVLQFLFFILYSNETNFVSYLKYFVVNIIYLNFLSPSVGDTLNGLYVNAINGSLWTLKIEVVFYLIVPILFYFYKKFGLKFILFLYIFSVSYVYLMDYLHSEKLLKQFPGQLRFFAIGILLYILYDKINKKYMYFLSLFSVVFLIYFYINTSSNYNYILYPVNLGILLFVLVFMIKNIKISFDFSYSIYIIHFPIIQLLLYFEFNMTKSIESFLLVLLMIFVIAFYLEKFIEKPSIKIGKQFLK